jgi:hypothetical protein
MTTPEYLEQCKQLDITIGQLRSQANRNKNHKWLSERHTITAPKTQWDYMIDALIQQKEVLKRKRDLALRYGYGFAK